MKIQVIIGSTRPGRITDRLAKWVVSEATKMPDFEVEIVDLIDYPMPMFDEPGTPRFNPHRQTNEPGKQFLAKINEADGYIVVTPEYNYTIPAVLKNAFDYIDFQVAKKPMAIVAHGSVGGARAIEPLKQLIIVSGAAVVPAALPVRGASEQIDPSGAFVGDTSSPYGPDKMIGKFLADLAWWTATLKAGREQS